MTGATRSVKTIKELITTGYALDERWEPLYKRERLTSITKSLTNDSVRPVAFVKAKVPPRDQPAELNVDPR